MSTGYLLCHVAQGVLSLSLWVWDFDSYWFFLMKSILNVKHFNFISLFLSECVDLLPICYMKLLNSKKKKKKIENENRSFFFFFLVLSIDRSSWRQSPPTKLAMPAQFGMNFLLKGQALDTWKEKVEILRVFLYLSLVFAWWEGLTSSFLWSLKFELLLFEENNK